MIKLTKKKKIINKIINNNKYYNIYNAVSLLKNISKNTKFIESVDIAINLNIDTRKSDQNIRGSVILPHGIGKNIYVAVFAQGKNAIAAKQAGADIVGMNDLFDKIKKNKYNFDIIIASPDTMNIVGQLGPILGPKGLMPNPKLGTITNNIFDAVKKAKTGQIRYRNDKYGIIHTSIGKINFEYNKLQENLETLLIELKKHKITKNKGNYIKKIYISTTMGPGIMLEQNNIYI